MTVVDIPKIIESLQASYGEAFFNTLALQLHQAIGADYISISRLNFESNTSRTISLVAKGKVVENVEYSLENTPCADIACQEVGIYPNRVCELYPDDQLLIDMNIEGYIGTSLKDSTGNVIGLLTALYEREIEDPELVANLFMLFSGRVSAEIERSEKEQELSTLNSSLEAKVEARTKQLSEALQNLRESQQQSIEHEKLASLGRLVAGVAHEINTPLGVAILGASTIQEHVLELKKSVEERRLTKSGLDRCMSDISEAENALEFNLQRAAELVRNFKQVAVEHNTDLLTDIGIKQWLSALLTSLRPMVKKYGIMLHLELPKSECVVITYPSKISQIITNLVSNAALHAFPSDFSVAEKQVFISFEKKGEEHILSVADNGVGMSEETLSRLFEPFYTTKRGEGGSGLGMSIVHNIVSNHLKGRLEVESEPNKGSTFKIIFNSLPV